MGAAFLGRKRGAHFGHRNTLVPACAQMARLLVPMLAAEFRFAFQHPVSQVSGEDSDIRFSRVERVLGSTELQLLEIRVLSISHDESWDVNRRGRWGSTILVRLRQQLS